jgi:transcriptional regulator with XRE-family HTH domain
MDHEGWRVRLEEAIERDGRSFREISLAAGLSHGYLHGILRGSKEPTLDRFVRLCGVLQVSTTSILVDGDPSESIKVLLDEMDRDPALRQRVVSILQEERRERG